MKHDQQPGKANDQGTAAAHADSPPNRPERQTGAGGEATEGTSKTGTEHELIADPGDFVYIPAGEVHVESNVSLTDPLEVLVTRNCPEAITVIVD